MGEDPSWLGRYEADEPTREELDAYVENPYRVLPPGLGRRLPFPDEPHVAVWSEYAERAEGGGAGEVLASAFPQLRFPIAEGTSGDPAYQAAVRRGEEPPAGGLGAELGDPAGIEIRIHPTAAGRVPVLVVRAREDFETLVRAFVGRNEPIPVPPSQGACLVKGLINWDRVRRYKEAWRARQGPFASEAAWAGEMKQLARDKGAYQDRVLLLSSGPYSGVSAQEAGQDEETWLRDSLEIRLHHEAFHYVTLRLFDRIRNHLLDELLADLAGLLGARGSYDAELARRFLGVGGSSAAAGARLEIYRAKLSDAAYRVLARMGRDATERLEDLVARREEASDEGRRPLLLLALAAMGLEGILAVDAGQRLERRLGVLEDREEDPALWSRAFPSDEESARAALEGFHAWAEDQVDEDVHRSAGIVLDELLTNVTKYAYPKDGPGWVEVEAEVDDTGRLRITVVDEGVEFDPLSHPPPDTTGDLDERPVGGLGVHLLSRLCREVRYERVSGRNRLTLEPAAEGASAGESGQGR